MPVDPWPDEPEEPNPEAQWSDPEHDLPQVPAPDTDETDVDPEIQETFWRSVILANVALFCLSLGPMLVYFRGQWLWGAAAIGLGAVAGFRVYQHYRAFERRHAADGSPDETVESVDADADDPERNA